MATRTRPASATRCFLVLAAGLAASASARAPAAPARPKSAAAYTLDGFRLGTPYAKVAARTPYDTPCDDDPIDERARRFMVYGARPCRDRTFPEATTVLFYIAFRAERPLEAPIEAFAYLGGRYFDTRGDFPVKIGTALGADGAAGLAGRLGQPVQGRLTLVRKQATLTATRFGGDIALLDDGQAVVGVVLGPMPSDPENEQWRGLMQMWDRYTRPRER